MAKIQLGVIFGSRTCEHEVSIISGIQLLRSVNREKYDPWPIYIAKDGRWYTGEKLLDISTYTPFDPYRKDITRVTLDLTAGSGALISYVQEKGLFAKGVSPVTLTKLDCIIPVMHGLHGEDGTLQGLLELANIPYSSTGVAGSAVGMDKIMMKHVFRGMGFPVLPDLSALRSEWRKDPEEVMDRVEKTLPYPVFCKPSCLGSSIGVSRADNRQKLREALDLAFSYDRRVLIEKGLDHPIEVNCSVLGFGEEAETSVTEMPTTSGGDLLDFADKYLTGSGSKGMASLKRIMPAPVGDEMIRKIEQLSKQIFRALDCKGVVRIDFMLTREDELYITEINTIPGSMAFYLWQKSGVSYPQLIDRLVDYARQAFEEKNENNYAFTSGILNGVTLGGKKGGKTGGKL
ncbi:MAG: D-alanine--D-alanine ligase [Clostridia bacterium]|nr:D-alanine--D-alanine ligase [Clostridia bacterium]